MKQEKQNLSDVEKLGNAYGDLAKKLKDVGTQGAEDIKKITDEITALEKKLKDVQGTGQKDLAGRGIDAQKELQAIKDKQAL